MALRHEGKGPRCYFCNKFGHIQRNCHEREKLTQEKSQPTRVTKTRQKVNSVETRTQRTASDEEEMGLVVQHVFTADGVNEPTGTIWIVDSGAISHVCSDRRLFSELTVLEKPLDIVLGHYKQIDVANTQVWITDKVQTLYVPWLTSLQWFFYAGERTNQLPNHLNMDFQLLA